MKTKEELNELKEEVEALHKKFHALSDDELENVTGGKKAPVEGKKYADKSASDVKLT